MSNKAEKRSVSTDALETLGNIITEKEKRDAIHLAVNPTQAKEKLQPGQDVSVEGTTRPPFVGIVDPFLRKPVFPGEWFWLVVYPRQITSLRHVWSHPSFPDADPLKEPEMSEEDKKKLEKVEIALGYPELNDFANKLGATPQELMDHARQWIEYGEEWNEGDRFMNYPDVPDEFWNYYEELTGKKVPSIKRTSFFSCSC